MKDDFSNSSEEEILNFYKKVSSNIRKFREKKGISQLELALDIGIKSVAFYSNCECNRYGKHFNLEHLYK
ncbi:helix-turn-helix transcriptional regulator, partial [Campylobacter coli]|nr:helix-turn-helix transcriptional regulator [Campylobacter coli]EDC4944904.1 helix-turn-helix transcriptional regulator [Campylobacter coli]EJF4591674.1 helix-turn-helix transcriptional regulator [Campylobacter coli]EKE4827263.1 helix-turn-helix transcriptional regulator [Campylobacter coli]